MGIRFSIPRKSQKRPARRGQLSVVYDNYDIAPVESRATKADWSIDDSWPTPGVMPYAIDPKQAHGLWNLSEQLLRELQHKAA